jgi:hypothetical protein
MAVYPPTTEAVTPSSPVTASIVPPIPTPTHGPGGNFAVLAKTRVSATPLAVLNVIRNTNEWKDWNTFCPRCTFSPKSPAPNPSDDPDLPTGTPDWLEVGSIVDIDVFMNGDGLVEGKKKSRNQNVVVTKIGRLEEGRKGYTIAWISTGWSQWQLRSERVMEFVETENGETEYDCWETFGGVLAVAVKGTVGGTLIERFGDYARDVKGFLEGKAGPGLAEE